MAKVNKIELGILFDNVETAQDYLDDLTSESREEVLGDLVREHSGNLTISVDGEVWQSVDKTSSDKCVLRVVFEAPKVSDDTLEDLADTEPDTVSKSVLDVLNGNDFRASFSDVI